MKVAWILHFGYAVQEDREYRYQRYGNDRNHNRKHIESILKTPSLEDWSGEVPEFWRGVR